MAENLIGRTLGRYQITALVGQGGMATVYRATHPGLEQTVAVKVLHAHMATDPDMLGRFRQEARAVAALRHPNIVRVVDFDCIDEVYFMVMEYVDGLTLSEHLSDSAAGGRRLPTAEVLQLFEPLCSAVDYAHRQGMIHRDIKPSNVLLTAQGEPVLTDYGIAKMIGVTQHTATGTVMGSAYYMSPEQAQGIAVDGRTDIYSLGVMLFESLTGQVPYEGDTLATVLVKHITAPVPAVCPLNAELPPLLDGLMRTALAKDPGERFQTGQALAAALRQGLRPHGTPAPAEPVTATRLQRPASDATTVERAGAAAVGPPPQDYIVPAGPPQAGGRWACVNCREVNDPDAQFCNYCGVANAAGPAAAAMAGAGAAASAGAYGAGQGALPPMGYPPPGGAAAAAGGASWGRWLVLAAALIAVAAVGVAVAFVMLRDKGGGGQPDTGHVTLSPSPSRTTPDGSVTTAPPSEPDVEGFLKEVEVLMHKSGQGMDGLQTATGPTTPGPDAPDAIQYVIDNRTEVRQRLGNLTVPDNYQARSCRSAFKKAMTYALAADNHYLDWAYGVGSKGAATPDNQRALVWKTEFVHIYNSLAAQYGNGMRHNWHPTDI
jgi:tRNA A-37 threonylcarbamoyl transferase component Bud32